jgi:uncharacterized membrane protein YkvA (DUF1232 family)
MVLHELVEQKVAMLGRLDVERDAPAFAQQLLAHHPEAFRRVARASGPAPAAATPAPQAAEGSPGAEATEHPTDRLAALLLARAQLRLILELPEHVTEMLALADDGRTAPHVRVALLRALAYLVQPAELVHDDAPGGYGYVDDCIVVKTMRLAMARMGVPLALDEGREVRALSLLALAFAPADFVRMQTLVTRTWNEAHLLHMMPAPVATAQAERLYRRPLDLRHDWTTPMPPITCTFPRLCAGRLGPVSGDGMTVGFGDGGLIRTTAAGDIREYA